MAEFDLDLVRHALTTAREHGFSDVELTSGDSSFRAVLLPPSGRKPHARQMPDQGPKPVELEHATIKSPLVGFYRESPKPLKVGLAVHPGDVVAVVNALGIANDVESMVSGEVVEVLVKDGDPVEFGQALAKVKA